MEADAFVAALVRWAERRDDIGAVLLVGSQARTEEPADRWSDVDVVLFVEEPARYLDDAGWVEAFGQPLLTFLERAPVGDAIERRVLYDDGLDVDFVVFPSTALELAAADPETAAVLGRGYRVLADRVGLTELAAQASALKPLPGLPSEDDLDALAADFWYHAVWAARKLARGELLTAKRSTDGYLKERLLTLLTWHAQAVGPKRDTWHEARFFERWADPRSVEALRDAYARYHAYDVRRALQATTAVFERFERETRELLGLAPPPDRGPVQTLVREALGAQARDPSA